MDNVITFDLGDSSKVTSIVSIAIISRSILLVKIVYFFVESFIKGATIYINFRLELNHF